MNLNSADHKMSADEKWANEFSNLVGNYLGSSYDETAERLRMILRTGLLPNTVSRDNPERFFKAHDLLVDIGPLRGPTGFWTRFTVHYNLFAGTVLSLGTPMQVESLSHNDELGCFALTEVFAGVNSGMVLGTTATFDLASDEFVINTAILDDRKNWISNGLTADRAVVVAKMIVLGKDYGPQAFLINLRDKNRRLLPGIELRDMGPKTIHNDLDNARIGFNCYKCKRTDLLSRYTNVSSDGSVIQSNPSAVFDRLFIGRLLIARACLRFSTALFDNAKRYASSKQCWAPKGERQALAVIPQVNSVLTKGIKQLNELNSFVNAVKIETCKYLQGSLPMSQRLQQVISCCKVLGVDSSIELCHNLKQEMGSYALMSVSGFGQTDFLQGCKFAEGDNRVLQLKMARDALNYIKKLVGKERKVAEMLQQQIDLLMGQNGGDKFAAWNESWELSYELARIHCLQIMQGFLSSKL